MGDFGYIIMCNRWMYSNWGLFGYILIGDYLDVFQLGILWMYSNWGFFGCILIGDYLDVF